MASGTGTAWKVTASKLDLAASCPRRLRRTLDPDVIGQRFPTNDRRFLLVSTIRAVIEEGHLRVADGEPSLEVALDRATGDALSAPSDLLPEERATLPFAVASYSEWAVGRVATWRGPVEMEHRSGTGRFSLALNAPLVFDRPDGGVEVRRVKLSAAMGEDRPWFATVAALLLQGEPTVVVDLHLFGDPVATEHVVEPHHLGAAGRDVCDLILSVIDDEDAPAVPGWGCHGCEHLTGCPAIVRSSLQEVFS